MNKDKIMLIGAAGFLGQNLLKDIDSKRFVVVPYTRCGTKLGDTETKALDITDTKSIGNFIKDESPDVIINTAGLISVKGCEQKKDLAISLNALAVAEMADAAISARVPLFSQISTDAVFSGNFGHQFTENDLPIPKNMYGISKRMGEIFLGTSSMPHQIIRTSLVIGDSPNPNERWTFQRSLLSKLMLGEKFEAMVDAINSPTYVSDVVGGIIWLIDSFASNSSNVGIFHVAGPEPISKYNLAKRIAREHGQNESLIVATTRDQVDSHYPPDTSLSVQKMQQLGFSAKKIYD
ncbi:SDR family oxidoreductase [Candidatus Woesebacteria bacterium]|nr:SDR family oxidoreductase [Candidatus Woesebacteria bacterium]